MMKCSLFIAPHILDLLSICTHTKVLASAEIFLTNSYEEVFPFLIEQLQEFCINRWKGKQKLFFKCKKSKEMWGKKNPLFSFKWVV